MKYLLSLIAILIISLCIYVIYQDIGTHQQELNSTTTNTQEVIAVSGAAIPDNTITTVDLSSEQPIVKTRNILVLGDSLTAGYGIVLEKSWVHLLEREVRRKFDEDYRVINAGISGDTTGGGLARLKQALDQHQPEIVIVELGGNDGLRGYPVKTIRNNLIQIIQTAKNTKAQVILAGIQIPPNYGERYTSSFAQIYPELATLESVPVIPFILDGVALKEEWMQNDGIHPNEEGQEQIKDNVLLVLEKILK